MLRHVSLIDDSTLAAARTTLEQLHATSVAHGRLVTTIAASGSESQDWTSLGTIACRVETAMGNTRQAAVMGEQPADQPRYEYIVYAAHDADVRTGDHLTLASGIVLSVMQDSRGQSQPFLSALYCTEVAS